MAVSFLDAFGLIVFLTFLRYSNDMIGEQSHKTASEISQPVAASELLIDTQKSNEITTSQNPDTSASDQQQASQVTSEPGETFDDSYKLAREEIQEFVAEKMGGRLGYRPFHARRAVSEFFSRYPLTRDEEAPSIKPVSREDRELLFNQIKELILNQEVGVGNLITDIYKAILANPDQSVDQLFEIVKEKAAELRLTAFDLHKFYRALELYELRHQTVAQYRKLYSDDIQLFKACFGDYPRGKVVAVPGPITLHFQCFDIHDYAFAANHYWVNGDATQIKRSEIDRAKKSGGLAIRTARNPDLENVLTLENVASNQHNDPIIGSEQYELGPKIQNIGLRGLHELIIHSNGEAKWKIEAKNQNDGHWPETIVIYEFDDPSRPSGEAIAYLDYTVIDHPEQDSQRGWVNHLATPEPPVRQYSLTVTDPNNRNLSLEIEISDTTLTLNNRSGVPLEITEQAANGYEPRITAHNLSEEIRAHEEQHQFNMLFTDQFAKNDNLVTLLTIAQEARATRSIRPRLIHDLVLIERRRLQFDNQARDEILAFYRDGTSLDEIQTILTDSPLYHFAAQNKAAISMIPRQIQHAINIELSGLFVDKNYKSLLWVSADDVRPFVEKVFVDEYYRDIAQWLGAIAILQTKGYFRYEIISQLFNKPAQAWMGYARRAPNASG